MNKFKKLLSNLTLATKNQKEKELWDVEGILHNQKLKFDLRPLKNNTKGGSFKTKADKIVFNIKDQFIIIDTKELHQYLKDNNTEVVNVEQLIFSLEWNIIIPK